MFDFLDTNYSHWSKNDIDNIIYAIARDNECNLIIEKVSENKPLLLYLCNHVLGSNENDAKWQFAEALSWLPDHSTHRAEELLLVLVDDHDEYVSRRALLALGKIKSARAEALAERAWGSGLEYQKISALWVLRDLSSQKLTNFLDMAVQDGSAHVKSNADEIRRLLLADGP